MTVAAPEVPGAVNRPVESMVPLLVVQATAGGLANAMLNWSSFMALNCCVARVSMDAVRGLTLIFVSVWFTVTMTLLVTERLPGSAIVTVKLYVPAALNVTVVFLAPLVPLALNVGSTAPLDLTPSRYI